ncbi:PEBP-like protein [Panus rudis PR-1116 ss-1]|nr:PEBP-like protein [Panus rudis PR-1116 ss-1]
MSIPSLDPVASVTASLKREKLIPEILPESFTPSILFSIGFPSSGKEVILGNEFNVDETQDEPEINFTPLNMPVEQADSDDEISYTLAMVDPDAPTRAEPIYRSFRHWLITGLKFPRDTASTTSDLTALKTRAAITPYRPPGPRPASGTHRYTFLLFQEPSGSTPFTIPEGSPEYGAALEERRSWDAVKFGEKYGLKLVGANYLLIHALEPIGEAR